MNQGKPSSLTSIAFNTGVTLERERIIKLLEQSDSVCADWAVAIIKGENKQDGTEFDYFETPFEGENK